MKPTNYRPLLQVSNDAKTVKGEKYGVLTGVMYLSPASSSGVINVCTNAGLCMGPCLNRAGRGAFDAIQEARKRKTVFLAHNREDFIASARYDVEALQRKADRLGMEAACRFNGTSDLPWLPLMLCGDYPRMKFYDYTKHPRPWLRTRSNYHLTFSLDGMRNVADAMDALAHGINVAVCFDTPKGQPLPKYWSCSRELNQWVSYPVIDGDLSDLRFTDPKGVIVGLRAKGPARHDTSGFVQIAGIA